MCDYCDCRSHPQIAALSEDHDMLLDQLAELERAIDAGDERAARPVLTTLHDRLHAHAGAEERGVFTELRNALGDEAYVRRFEDDHRLLHGLAEASAGTDWRSAARALVQQLREHIGREETDLFPAAHQMLTPAQWASVDASAIDRVAALSS